MENITAGEPTPHKGVFISYNRKFGASAARLIFHTLKSKNYDVFFDIEQASPGRFEQVILNQIGLRDHFILVITPQTIDILREPDSWPRREALRALELKKNVIPVLMEDAEPIKESDDLLFAQLGKLNQLEVAHNYFEAGMAKLISGFLRQPTLQQLNIKTAEEHYETALKSFQNKEWEKAKAEITLGITLAPNKPEYYYMRSMANHWLYNDDEAIADIDLALTFDPSALELANAKQNILMQMGKEKEALQFFIGWMKKYNKSSEADEMYLE